ncbi:STAS/SEC14 domain-containing protein [Pelagicoccus sp. SDUM812003]|uniref:STAS/SEC14 domain-containing protein n=1 Tax=Pelagicoccus sp. SDUM812003 TaxID=3041267 RepID=UPI00280CA9DF|nr:STAS/SEC14 domain-containing protein [Pelagicoccus sp. SDUM812003]MDQ8203586.1 STAS/SEC14 domain-containing protein [Pelagicoccus sp. SDUM812003]
MQEVAHNVSVRKEANGKILLVSISGKLERADYEIFVPEIDEEVKRHGQVRLLLDFAGFQGMTVGAFFEDVKFAITHYHAITRIAMVGDKKWERVMASLCKPFTKAQIYFYDLSDMDLAKAWLREGT